MDRLEQPRKVAWLYAAIKRALDFVIALVALAILAIPMLAIAIAIRAQDGGSPLFRQARVGRHGEPFAILKFRTMVVDAQARGGHQTDAGDVRITPLGRLLRRSSIDELPQLINVLKGDMSLIGPRPDVPAQRSDYAADEWSRRHTVRPGITGLAQASDRSLLTPARRTALDLEYVDRMGPRLDARVIAMTVAQIMKGGST